MAHINMIIRPQDCSDVLGYSECIKIMNHILGRYFKIKTDNTYCLFFKGSYIKG